jgi:hypothetical protein
MPPAKFLKQQLTAKDSKNKSWQCLQNQNAWNYSGIFSLNRTNSENDQTC